MITNILTKISGALFPILRKAAVFYGGLPLWARLLALAAAAILSGVAAYRQVYSKEDTAERMGAWHLICYAGCLPVVWCVLRHYPLTSFEGISPIPVLIGLIILAVLFLKLLFSGRLLRALQIVLNLAGFLMLAALCGSMKRPFWGTLLFIVAAILALLEGIGVNMFSELKSDELRTPKEKATEETAKAEARAKAEANLEAELRAKAEAKLEAKARAKAEAELEAKARAKAEAEARAKAEAEAKAKAEAEAKAKAEAEAKRESELKPETKPAAAAATPAAKTELKPAAKPVQATTVAKPEPTIAKQASEADVKTASASAAKTEAKPVAAKAQPKAEPRPAAKPAPAAEARPKTEPKPSAAKPVQAAAPAKTEPKPAAKPAPAPAPAPKPVPRRKVDPAKLHHLNVAAIGSSQVGKTTLTAAITKVVAARYGTGFRPYTVEELDCAPEERKYRFTVESSFVEYGTPERYYTHFDCPGFPDYTHNLIRGMAAADVAILVVSPVEFPNWQMTENLCILRTMPRLSAIIVYVNRLDQVEDANEADLIVDSIQGRIEEAGLSELVKETIWGSALQADRDPTGEAGDSIVQLLETLDELPLPERIRENPFYMPIYKTFRTPGRGTVITGVVKRGTARVGDPVEICGFSEEPIRSTIAEIQCARRPWKQAEAGDSVGIRLNDPLPAAPRHGQAAATPGKWMLMKKINTSLDFLTREEGGLYHLMWPGAEVMLYCGELRVAAVLSQENETNPIGAGVHIELIFDLKQPVPIHEGDPILLRQSSTTIATGRVIRMK